MDLVPRGQDPSEKAKLVQFKLRTRTQRKKGLSPMQVAALEAAGMVELLQAGTKCWKGL